MKGHMKTSWGRTNRFLVFVLPFAMVTSLAITQNAQGAATQTKATMKTNVLKQAGRVTDIANTILSGKGAPSASLGLLGDFYIDTSSMNFYGPKTSTKWPTPISLKGPAGPIGPSGIDGKTSASQSGLKGDTGLTGAKGLPGDTGPVGPAGPTGSQGSSGPAGAGSQGATGATGSTGAQGPQGPQGATGSAGLKGDTGISGTTGATGLQGATGATGAQGPQGATGSTGLKGDTGTTGTTGATGLQGATGLTGAQGATGQQGATGSQGSQGLQGATGPAGPSEIQYLDLPTFKIKGSGAQSVSFGTLVNGISYSFSVILTGDFATSPASDPGLGASITCTGSTSLFKSSVAVSTGSFSTAVSFKTRTFVMINGVVVASGSNASLRINVYDFVGNSAGNEITFSGTVLIQRVESLVPAATM